MKDKLIEEVTTPDGHIAGAKLTGILRANQLLKEFETALATGHPSPKAATKLLLALGLEDLVSSGDVTFVVFCESMSRELGPLCPADTELRKVHDAFKRRRDATKDVL